MKQARHDLVITPQVRPLIGSVPSPPDENLGNLALFFAALSDDTSEIRRLGKGADVTAMTAALRQLGVEVAEESDGVTRVVGRTLRGLREAAGPVSTGTSLSTMVRLASALVGHPFRTTLVSAARGALGEGHPTTERRAAHESAVMTDVAGALRRRAAQVEGAFAAARPGKIEAPFLVGPLAHDYALSGLEHETGAPDRHVKEALLLSALYADEATFVRETTVSCDHAERMLEALGVPVLRAGSIVQINPEAWDGKIPAFSCAVPGDVSAAVLFLAMATLVKDSRVCVRNVVLSPTRTGAFDWLRQLGGPVDVAPSAASLGEMEGTVCASYAPLRAVALAGEVFVHGEADFPVLAAVAARAAGTTEIALGDVRMPWGDAESVASVLRAFGVQVHLDRDQLSIEGRPGEALQAAQIDAEGDAAAASTALLLGLVADGPTTIRNVDALAFRFPRFVGTMRAIGADVRVSQREA